MSLLVESSATVFVGTFATFIREIIIEGDFSATSITITENAAAGRVLTSDAVGTGTWNPDLTMSPTGLLTVPQLQLTTGAGAGLILQSDATGVAGWVAHGGFGTGNVVGPNLATDRAIALYSGTTGKEIQNSVVTVSGSGDITTAGGVFGDTLKITAGAAAGFFLQSDASGNGTWVALAPGTGDVAGPVSATDRAIATYSGTTGKEIQNSGVTITPANVLVTPALQITTGAAAGLFLQSDAGGNVTWVTLVPGTGDVVGPVSATDRSIAIYNGTTGKSIQDSVITITPANVLSTPALQITTGAATNSVLVCDATGNALWTSVTAAEIGNVVGPGAGATDNAVVRYSGTTGKIVQDSSASLSDSGVLVANVLRAAVGGSAAAPAFSFATNDTSGMLQANPNEIALATGGVVRATLTNTSLAPAVALHLPPGSEATPALAFSTDTTTGVFHAGGVADMQFVSGGSTAIAVNANRNLALAAATPANYGATTPGQGVVFIGPATTNPVGIPNGGGGGGILYVNGNTLNWLDGAGVAITLSGGGGNIVVGPSGATANALARFNGSTGLLLKNSNTNLTDVGLFHSVDGSAAAPVYSFTADPTTGIFSPAVGEIAIAVAGVQEVLVTANQVVSAVQFNALTGSDLAPSYSFTGDTDTGIRWVSSGAIGVVSNGTMTQLHSDTGTATINGTALLPSYSFINDATSGMYSGGAGVLAFATGATTAMGLQTGANVALAGGQPSNYGATTAGQGVIFLNDATTIPVGVPNGGGGGILYVNGNNLRWLDAAGAVTNLDEADVKGPALSTATALARFEDGAGNILKNSTTTLSDGGQMLSVDGITAAPTYSFSSEPGSGFFIIAPVQMGISVAGTLEIVASTARIQFGAPLWAVNGSDATPSYSFEADTDTGLKWISSGAIGVVSNGVTTAILSNTGTALIDGTSLLPSYSFITDATSGMYSGGAGVLGFAAGATTAMALETGANVALAGGKPGNYGATTPGEGVVFIRAATTDPVGIPNSGAGGILYVNGNNLNWLNAAGVTKTVNTRAVLGPSGATANALARFDTTTGLLLKNSATTLSDAGLLHSVDGTAGAPVYSFTTDPDTGMFLSAPGALGLATSGVQRAVVTDTSMVLTVPIETIDGTAPAPAYTFGGDTDTGIFRASTNEIGIATEGVQRLSVSDTGIVLAVNIQAPNGSVAAPTYSFGTDTGFFGAAANEVGITTGGVLRLTVNDVVAVSTVPIRASSGSAAAPVYSFATDTDTGMFLVSSNQIGIANSGVQQLLVNSSGVVATSPIKVPDGSDTLPAYSFSSDLNTGLKLIAPGIIGVVTDGTTTETLSVNGTALINGTALLPSYSFINDATSGVYSGGVGVLGFAAGASTAMTLETGPNVALAGGKPSNYGVTTPGAGVLFLNDASTNPVGIPNGGTGGILYVDGDTLNYLTSTGVPRSISTVAYATFSLSVTSSSPSSGNSHCPFNQVDLLTSSFYDPDGLMTLYTSTYSTTPGSNNLGRVRLAAGHHWMVTGFMHTTTDIGYFGFSIWDVTSSATIRRLGSRASGFSRTLQNNDAVAYPSLANVNTTGGEILIELRKESTALFTSGWYAGNPNLPGCYMTVRRIG